MDCRKEKYLHKIILVFTVISMVLIIIAPKVIAKSKEEQRVVKVAFPSQGGMGEIGEGGDLIGYNYSYLQKVAEYAGWKIEYTTFENQTSDEQIMSAINMVMNGEADLIGPMIYNEQVASMFDFPKNNYGVVYTTLCADEKSNISSVNLYKYQPLKVAIYKAATTRNSEVKEYLEQMKIEYELIECDSTEEQIELIENKQADVLSSITLSYFDGTKSVAQFAPRPYYFASTKGNSELIKELDDAIEALNYTQPFIQEQLQNEFFSDTSGGYVLTDEEIKYISSVKNLNVLCMSNYQPYCSKDSSNNPSGVLISLLNDFSKTNDIEINYNFCDNISDLEKKWETGKYDCVIGLPFSSNYCAKNKMVQTSPIISVSIVLFGHPKTQKKQKDSVVAIYDQLSDEVELDNFKKVIKCATIEECYEAVESGLADYGCANRLGVDYQIIERNSTFVCTPLMGEQLDLCIAVSSQHDYRMMSALNKYIHTLPDSKITGYLSDATHHSVKQGIGTFVRSQPVIATFLFTIIGVLLICSIMFAFNSNRNKKRNKKLEEANNAKSDFLSRMSHDIRTPMNAILGFAELGKQDLDSPELLADDLDKISSSGKFLLGLVNDILDMTKIENKAMELNLQPYLMKEFSKEINALIQPLCIEKNISFNINIADDVPKCLNVDKLRINQILFNLLSNAVKFTKNDGYINVLVNKIASNDNIATIEFVVEDNGIGMSDEFQKHMFEIFSQEHQHISGKEGTGLGLPIVYSLVEIMKGTINVESKQGIGSKFTVVLPLVCCDIPIEESLVKRIDSIERLNNKNVLLCEDHPINTKLACKLLEKVGINVVCATNGKEGLDIFKQANDDFFDVILMDIRMPVMDGIEATKAIRKLNNSIPIIAITANAFDDDVKICKEAGMNEHLAKPFNVDMLYEVLLKYIVVE